MYKVFVLLGVDYDDAQLAGVFSSEEKADKAKQIMEEKFPSYFFRYHEEKIDPESLEWSTGTDLLTIDFSEL